MTRRWVVNGVVLGGLWLFVRGVAATPARVAGEFFIGLAVGLPVAYGIRRLYPETTPLASRLRAAPYAALYVLAFLAELVRANFDVAYRVLAPSMPIEPAVVELPLRVRTDAAVTTIANSITLTPGTLTMDYDGERNTLYVHSIDGSDPDAVIEPIRTWEDYALVIFDEELKPGDPVPAPDGGRAEAGDNGETERDPGDGGRHGGEGRGD